ncbi:hypothetical protein J6590_029465 [Homalodisca vitripennis]|nr:hypothetical protein J6590_029465 [Homalodisca vitripennis]
MIQVEQPTPLVRARSGWDDPSGASGWILEAPISHLKHLPAYLNDRALFSPWHQTTYSYTCKYNKSIAISFDSVKLLN